jgi:hypothetical protein
MGPEPGEPGVMHDIDHEMKRERENDCSLEPAVENSPHACGTVSTIGRNAAARLRQGFNHWSKCRRTLATRFQPLVEMPPRVAARFQPLVEMPPRVAGRFQPLVEMLPRVAARFQPSVEMPPRVAWRCVNKRNKEPDE